RRQAGAPVLPRHVARAGTTPRLHHAGRGLVPRHVARPASRLALPPMADLLRTPLHEVHLAHGARMVPFAGYEMPVQYTGVVAEHQAVRRAAGLFDVSHMGELV